MQEGTRFKIDTMGVTQLHWTGLIWATSDEVDKRGFQIEPNIARSRASIRPHHKIFFDTSFYNRGAYADSPRNIH